MADPSYVVDGILEDGDAFVPIESTSLASVSGLQWDTGTGHKNWSQYEDLLVITSTKGSGLQITLDGLGGSSYFHYQYLFGSDTTAMASDAGSTYGRVYWATSSYAAGGKVMLSGINSQSFTKCISQVADPRQASSAYAGWYATTFIYFWGIHRIDLDFDSGSGQSGSHAWLYGILPRMGLVS